MKIQHKISFNNILNLEKRLLELGLEHDPIAKGPEGRLCFFYIYEEDAAWETVKKLIEKYGVWDVEKVTFSKEEKEQAEWSFMHLASAGYPQPETNFEFLGHTYDVKNYCKHCGIGKEQNNAFRLKKDPMAKNREFMALNWIADEVFVRPVVKDVFQKENLKGIDFSNPKLMRTGQFINDLFQMKINFILKEGLVNDQMDSSICSKDNEGMKNPSQGYCGRTKYLFPRRIPLTFKKELFKGAPDLVKSNEWFGSGKNASRLILVSKRARKIIEREKWRGAFFDPVIIK
jgi:hypothetical protein